MVLQQHRGLPVGGHLSASLVELVEFTCDWPFSLQHRATARYRDNFFITTRENDETAIYPAMANDLTTLLAMPVKLENVGSHVRCLELRLKFSLGLPVNVTIVFRTDDDRQGEDHTVTSWTPKSDPRIHLVLPSLASKIRLYHMPGTRAAILRATAFVRSRGYPMRWWARYWALALVRQGAVVHCLPDLLRRVLNGQFGRTPPIWMSQFQILKY